MQQPAIQTHAAPPRASPRFRARGYALETSIRVSRGIMDHSGPGVCKWGSKCTRVNCQWLHLNDD
jgi:hypothetical protein